MDPNQNEEPTNFSDRPRPNDMFEPDSQPFPPTPAPEQTPAPAPEKQRSGFAKFVRSKLFVVSLIVLILALAAGGVYYCSNTNRVLRDVLLTSVTTTQAQVDGTVTFTSKSEQNPLQVTTRFDSKGNGSAFSANTETKITAGAADLNVKLDFVTDKDAAYLKLGNAKELGDLASTLVGDNPFIGFYKPLLEKLDDTWIKIDTPSSGEGNEEKRCNIEEISSIIKNNSDMLGSIFKQHQFVTAERSGFSLTEQQYNLSFDNAEGQEFAKKLMETELFKMLKEDCGFSDESLMGTPADDSQTKEQDSPTVNAKLWVNPFTHDPKKLAIMVEDEEFVFSLELNLNLGQTVDITTPTDATSFGELLQSFQQEQIEQQIEQLQGSGEITPEQLEQFQQYQLEASSQSL